MKTIHGNVISTTPISLSKAATILSKFASADTGASHAVSAYLRRASASFNELKQLHKELKSNRKHKIKTPKSETVTEDEKLTRSVVSNQRVSQSELSREPRELGHGVSDGDSNRKKHKKKKKKKKDDRGWFGNSEKSEVELVDVKVGVKNEENVESDLNVEKEKKKQRKNRVDVVNLEGVKERVKAEKDGNMGMEDERKGHKKKKGKNEDEVQKLEEDKCKLGTEEDGDVGKENERKKHKKKRESEIGDVKGNGSRIVIKDEGKKKKRKIEEAEEGKEMNSDESQSKKKKKRKSEGK